MSECTEERFLKDVSGHKMEIIKDNGVYRHLRFSDGSFNMRFDIVTWPGHLCYAGDMGEYLFARVEDMFTFFRASPPKHQGFFINTGYWAEKCLAAGIHDGISEYNPEKAREDVREILVDHEASDRTTKEVCDILSSDSENEYELRQAISDMDHDPDGIFDDFWEVNLHARPYRYIWCCYALVWGIALYDAASSK